MATSISKVAILRPVPASSFEPVAGILVDDLVGDGSPNDASQKIEQVVSFYPPAQLIKIASKVSSLIDYPDEGTNTLPAQTGTTSQITLPSVNAPIIPGLLIAIISGTGAGQVRRIGALSSGTTYNLNNFQMSGGSVKAWSPQPGTGAGFRLLIDAYKLGLILMKTEYDANNITCTLVPVMYGLPVSNFPTRFDGSEVAVANLAYTTDSQQNLDDSSTYYQGTVQSAGVAGAIGAKVRLKSLSSGHVSLWAACV